MVVVIHATVFIHSSGTATALNYYLIRRACDFGVIFFFAVTGFFIAKDNNEEKIKKSILKLTSTYFFASFSLLISNIFFIFIEKILYNYSVQQGFLGILQRINVITILNGEMINESLWYLPAAIISSMIFYYFIKYKFSTITIVSISITIYAVLNYSSFDLLQLTTYGGFPKGLVSMTVGYLAFKYGQNYRYSLQYGIGLIILGSILALKQHNLIIIFMMASSFFILSFSKYNLGKRGFFSNLGANGFHVYIFHGVFIRLTSLVFHYFQIEKLNNRLLYVTITIVLSFALSPKISKFMHSIYSRLGVVLFSKK